MRHSAETTIKNRIIEHGPTTQIMPRSEYEKRVLDKFHAHRRWENELAPDWVTVKI